MDSISVRAGFGPVTAQRPALRLTGGGDLDLAQIQAVEAVTAVAEYRLATVPAGSAGQRITVAGVDPRQFRVFTPQVTADAIEVWQRVNEGDAAFTHATGHALDAALGTMVRFGSEGAVLRVGAYASNGVPPIADALVSVQRANALGLDGRRSILVALDPEADARLVGRRLRRSFGASVEMLTPPDARRAFLTGGDAREVFEPFTYFDNGDGMIEIDPEWVRRNIVTRPVPVLTGEVTCHRLMVEQLAGALGEIEARGLARLIDPSQYGGCWVARHIDFNPAKPLSMHAWGLAADFNVSTNGLGEEPTLDLRIVRIFERWGFVWGGRWQRPDGMHFELGALLDSPRG